MENILFDASGRIVFDIAALHLNTIIPMLVTLCGALLIMILDLVKKQDKGLYVALSTIILAIDLYLVIIINDAGRGFFDVLLVDGIAVISQVIILVASLLFIPLALSGHRFKEFKFAEHFAFFLFMIAGFQFMVSSDNLILIFIVIGNYF